jgi:hypothetical protein
MFAAAGILIPIAIHLWNVRQGKILKVGSVALLAEQAIQNTSSIKLHELLLLLLRCLLILLLAVLLAKPQWLPANSAKEKGWVLVPPSAFNKTYTHFKPQVDSLLQAGYALHYFDAGLAETNIGDSLKDQTDTVSGKPALYWQTISQLNSRVDTTVPLYIFTDNKLANFIGDRPAASLNIHWFTYNHNDSAILYPVEAYKTYGDSIRIVTASSKPTGIFTKYNDVGKQDLTKLGYTLKPINGSAALSVNNKVIVSLDTAELRVSIFADSHPNDAMYVKAAVEAVRQFSKRDIKVNMIEKIADIPSAQDWLFWLSEKPLPENFAAQHILKYEAGKDLISQGWLTPAGEFSDEGDHTILSERTQAGQDIENIIWQDGYGNAVLGKDEAKPVVYQFYSRFDPSWNGLPWGSAFPKLILKLLVDENKTATVNDNRMIDENQLQPYLDNTHAGKKKIAETSIDLSNIFWLLAAVIFLTERIVAYRNKKEVANAA